MAKLTVITADDTHCRYFTNMPIAIVKADEKTVEYQYRLFREKKTRCGCPEHFVAYLEKCGILELVPFDTF